MKEKFLNGSIKRIKKKYPEYDEEKLEIIAYGLEALYITITKTVVIFGVAIILGILKETLLIMLSYNKEEKEKVIKSNSEKTVDMDIVLLVNEYSASATEIVSAALQENDAATIVGTKTYGKGVMQEVLPIFEGALKVSIEEFKTPKGNKINKEGITPDVVVEEDPTTLEDEQLQKAIELLK